MVLTYTYPPRHNPVSKLTGTAVISKRTPSSTFKLQTNRDAWLFSLPELAPCDIVCRYICRDYLRLASDLNKLLRLELRTGSLPPYDEFVGINRPELERV